MTPARQILEWLGPRDRGALGVAACVGAGLGLAGWGAGAVLPLGVLAALCLAIVLIDGRHYLIPDLISAPLLGLGLIWALAQGAPVVARVLAMAILGLALLGLRAVFQRLRGRTALGLGDVKLMLGAAAWLPPDLLPALVFLSALSGLAETALRRPAQGRIAFGRHLAPWLFALVAALPWLDRLDMAGLGVLTP